MFKRIVVKTVRALGFGTEKPPAEVIVDPGWLRLLAEAKAPLANAKMSFSQALTAYWRNAKLMSGRVTAEDYERAAAVLGADVCEFLRIRQLLGYEILSVTTEETHLRWLTATAVPIWLRAVLAEIPVTVSKGITAAFAWRAARALGLEEPQPVPVRAAVPVKAEAPMHIIEIATGFPIFLRVTDRDGKGPIEVHGGGTIHRDTLSQSGWKLNGGWLNPGPQGGRPRPGNGGGNPVAPPAQPKR